MERARHATLVMGVPRQSSPPPRGRPRRLTISTNCETVEQFVRTHCRSADEGSLFLKTRHPLPPGPRRPFVIRLSSGEPIMNGEGEVIESVTKPQSGDPAGMRIKLLDLDAGAQAVHAKLLAAARRGSRPVRVPPPVPRPSMIFKATTEPAGKAVSEAGEDPDLNLPEPKPLRDLTEEAEEIEPETRSRWRSPLRFLPPTPRVALPVQWLFLAGATTGFLACVAGIAMGYGIWGGDPEEPGPPERAVAGSPALAIATAEAAARPAEGPTAGFADPKTPAKPAPPRGRQDDAVAVLPGEIEAPRQPPPAAPQPAEIASPAPPPADVGSSPPTPSPPAAGSAGHDACTATLTARPRRAEVLWNGKLLGRTPLDGVPVPCGSATVEFDRPRYKRETRRASAAPGNPVRLSVRLSRPPAVLKLSSAPRGAEFEVAGRAVGRGPTETTVRAFEKIAISATKGGYQRWSQTVYVRRRGSKVTAVLRPAATRRRVHSSGYDLMP